MPCVIELTLTNDIFSSWVELQEDETKIHDKFSNNQDVTVTVYKGAIETSLSITGAADFLTRLGQKEVKCSIVSRPSALLPLVEIIPEEAESASVCQNTNEATHQQLPVIPQNDQIMHLPPDSGEQESRSDQSKSLSPSELKLQSVTRSRTQTSQHKAVADVREVLPVKRSARISKKVALDDFITTTSRKKRTVEPKTNVDANESMSKRSRLTREDKASAVCEAVKESDNVSDDQPLNSFNKRNKNTNKIKSDNQSTPMPEKLKSQSKVGKQTKASISSKQKVSNDKHYVINDEKLSEWDLETHNKNQCLLCGEIFSMNNCNNQVLLRTHLTDDHSISYEKHNEVITTNSTLEGRRQALIALTKNMTTILSWKYCQICHTSVSNLGQMTRHMADHKDHAHYTQIMERIKKLELSMKEHRQKTAKRRLSESNTTLSNQRKYLPEPTQQLYKLMDNELAALPKSFEGCLLCGKTWEQSSKLKQHLYISHKVTHDDHGKVLVETDLVSRKAALEDLVQLSKKQMTASGNHCPVCFKGCFDSRRLFTHMTCHSDHPQYNEYVEQLTQQKALLEKLQPTVQRDIEKKAKKLSKTQSDKATKIKSTLDEEIGDSTDEKGDNNHLNDGILEKGDMSLNTSSGNEIEEIAVSVSDSNTADKVEVFCGICSRTFHANALFRRHINNRHKLTWVQYVSIMALPDEKRAQKIQFMKENRPGMEKTGSYRRNVDSVHQTIECVECKQFYPCKEYRQHLVLSHPEVCDVDVIIAKMNDAVDQSYAQSMSRFKVTCPYCSMELIRSQIFKHMKKQHSVEIDYTDKVSQVEHQVKQQTNINRNRAREARTELNIKFCCRFCGFQFKDTSTRTTHEKYRCKQNINRKQSYTCKFCGQIGRTQAWLEEHVKIHNQTGGPNYICSQCGKGYINKSGLEIHKAKDHKKIIRFTCPICSKKFYVSSHYKAHLLTHTNEKAAVCDLCNKRYKSSLAVRRHKRTMHFKDCPRHCRKCGHGLGLSDDESDHKCEPPACDPIDLLHELGLITESKQPGSSNNIASSAELGTDGNYGDPDLAIDDSSREVDSVFETVTMVTDALDKTPKVVLDLAQMESIQTHSAQTGPIQTQFPIQPKVYLSATPSIKSETITYPGHMTSEPLIVACDIQPITTSVTSSQSDLSVVDTSMSQHNSSAGCDLDTTITLKTDDSIPPLVTDANNLQIYVDESGNVIGTSPGVSALGHVDGTINQEMLHNIVLHVFKQEETETSVDQLLLQIDP